MGCDRVMRIKHEDGFVVCMCGWLTSVTCPQCRRCMKCHNESCNVRLVG